MLKWGGGFRSRPRARLKKAQGAQAEERLNGSEVEGVIELQSTD